MPVPISPVSPSVSNVVSSALQTPNASAPFSDLLRDAVGQVRGLEADASNLVQGLITGAGVDVHTALIATQKADAAFEMALSFRNKAVAAYQQLMGTQF